MRKSSHSQKFLRGDVVFIAKDLGSQMSHFPSGQEAIVLGSYRDQYGGDKEDAKEYTLQLLKDGNHVAWYEEHQLTYKRRLSRKQLRKL